MTAEEVFDAVKSFAYLIYAVVAALASVAVGAAICTVQTVAEYLIGCTQVLVIRPGGLPDRRHVFTPPAESDPARPSYFYGPARSDLRYIRQVAWSRWQHAAGSWGDLVGDMLDMAEDSHKVTGPPAVGLAIGLIVAVPLAAVLVVAAGLTHEVVVDAATVSVRCTATALRAVDSALLRVRHIKVRCVACFERLSYPAYLCPNPECRDIHWDVRPGPYGCCAGSAAAVNPCPPCCCSGPHGGWMDLLVPCLQAASRAPAGQRARSHLPHFRGQGRRQDTVAVWDRQDVARPRPAWHLRRNRR